MGFAVDAGYGIVIWIAIFALIGLSSIGPLPMAARSREASEATEGAAQSQRRPFDSKTSDDQGKW